MSFFSSRRFFSSKHCREYGSLIPYHSTSLSLSFSLSLSSLVVPLSQCMEIKRLPSVGSGFSSASSSSDVVKRPPSVPYVSEDQQTHTDTRTHSHFCHTRSSSFPLRPFALTELSYSTFTVAPALTYSHVNILKYGQKMRLSVGVSLSVDTCRLTLPPTM